MLFDVKINKFELTSDGKIYIEYSPYNPEINNYIINCNTYDIIDDSIEKTLNHYKDLARIEVYNALPEEIKQLYVNAQYKINNSIEDPTNIDYDILGYHKKRTIIFGELRKTEYYKNYDGNAYSDLILEELRDYTRDENGMCLYRIQTTNWYLNNEETGTTKVTQKYYTLSESIEEGITRRSNVIASAKSYTLSQLGRVNSFDFLYTVKDPIQFFIDGNTQPLRDAIQNSTKTYLNDTIKAGMLENLRLS